MSDLFRFQLLASFVVGGLAVTLLTLLAEQVHPRTAGIILSLPTNLAVSLFFIGWTLSPGAVAEAAIGIPASLGASLIFVAIYVWMAARIRRRTIGTFALTFVCGLLGWLVIALPLALYIIQSIALSLVLYVFLACVAHMWLNREAEDADAVAPIRYTFLQRSGRALFAGFLIMMVVYLSKTLGPLWGGVFSVFPAATSSGLLILHWQRDAEILKKVYRTVPLGSPIFLLYTLMCVLTFPGMGIVLGTILSYIACFIAVWVYLRFLQRTRS